MYSWKSVMQEWVQKHKFVYTKNEEHSYMGGMKLETKDNFHFSLLKLPLWYSWHYSTPGLHITCRHWHKNALQHNSKTAKIDIPCNAYTGNSVRKLTAKVLIKSMDQIKKRNAAVREFEKSRTKNSFTILTQEPIQNQDFEFRLRTKESQ